MTQSKQFWNEKYAEQEDLWGLRPEQTLVTYEKLIPENGKILDLGIGEGRNSIYFASKGWSVDGVDIADTAVDRCRQMANQTGFDIHASIGDLRDFHIQPESYSLIIMANILNFFHDDEINAILKKVKAGLIEGGLAYIQAFDIHDPSFSKRLHLLDEKFNNTLYNPKTDSYMHYFTVDELQESFMGYKTIKCSQSIQMDLGHGEPHHHGLIELLVQKNKDTELGKEELNVQRS
ncbi:class I SAM-dependent methyltransferase [Falsibacillus albus]|uniref:Class I SAM-dependent methyltransferase n=1 Tax=Falsibacillus albus TaxID=2478915 RepID=A0A3L7JGS4_9BACI|nr:class I SAM-dependent methyltransferase [Falsibacillus albus]RLQ89987.1 class I SAM-dependent methyltransferase [Falsibacillus albus]